MARIFTQALLTSFLLLTATAQAQLGGGGAAAGGTTCADAVTVTGVPFADANLLGIQNLRSTCSSGDNYDEGNACNNMYMSGNDFVYHFTPTSVSGPKTRTG